MDHFPARWGRPRDGTVEGGLRWDGYGGTAAAGTTTSGNSTTGHALDSFSHGVQHTQQPIVTGTSVIAIQYDKGVMMAADTLASYGSLARFKDQKRLHAVGRQCIVGAGGDISDFQHCQEVLDKMMKREDYINDGHVLRPSQIYEYLSRLLYARRSKVDPLWNSFIVAGWESDPLLDEAPGQGRPFLAYVDLLGTTYSAPSLATGFGGYLAQPILRKRLEGRLKARHVGTTESPASATTVPAQSTAMETDSAPKTISPQGDAIKVTYDQGGLDVALQGGGGDAHVDLTEAEAREAILDCMRVLFYRDARSINKFQIGKVTAAGIEISEPESVDTKWEHGRGLRGYGTQTD